MERSTYKICWKIDSNKKCCVIGVGDQKKKKFILGNIVPNGHIWKFDLKKTFSLDFGVKCNFSKIRIEHVMLKFLATTENTKKTRSEDSNYNCGKVVKSSRGKFPIHSSNEIRAVLFLAEDGN